jgi:hypothetical protein
LIKALKQFFGATPRVTELKMTQEVVEQIRHTIGRLPAEQGGLLGGRLDDGIVRKFHFDDSARRSRATYTPDRETLNRVLSEDWNPSGIRLLGYVHSHPPGVRQPTGGDLTVARKQLQKSTEIDHLFIPIAFSSADTDKFEMLAYAAVRDGEDVRLEQLETVVVDETREPAIKETSPDPTTAVPEPALSGSELSVPATAPTQAAASGKEAFTFYRVLSAYDLDLLRDSRLIYVGLGGGAGFAEECARAGVGQHIFIDHDTVSETNLATQQTYRRDIGRPKVDCVAERVRDINPNALAVPLRRSLDKITDGEFELLATGQTEKRPVKRSLICGMTDSFDAQARVNRLALELGLPSLCAQVYPEGRGAEITFTHPETTPACHRCALNSRYRAFLERGLENEATSDGTPIFSTTRLNALKGYVAMAILHHGTEHARWGSVLSRIGNRNLIQIRMDPDFSTTVGLKVFDRVLGGADAERVFCDETVWLPQLADGPATGFPTCPDCGGTGDLRKVIGTFHDTRFMRE